MSDRQMIDATEAFNKMQAQLFLIRILLRLSPIHDPVQAVRVLHDEGKEAFEKLRGEPCSYASEWKP